MTSELSSQESAPRSEASRYKIKLVSSSACSITLFSTPSNLERTLGLTPDHSPTLPLIPYSYSLTIELFA